MTLINLPIAAMCLLGFVIAGYAYSVEMRADEEKRMGRHYKAACDIGPFSCTRVFSSEFGSVTQFFGLPKVSNAALGMLFYLVEACCCWSPTVMLLLSIQGLMATLGFAYILFFVMHDVCIVCCSIYVVNITTAVLSYRWWRKKGHTRKGTKTERAKKA